MYTENYFLVDFTVNNRMKQQEKEGWTCLNTMVTSETQPVTEEQREEIDVKREEERDDSKKTMEKFGMF